MPSMGGSGPAGGDDVSGGASMGGSAGMGGGSSGGGGNAFGGRTGMEGSPETGGRRGGHGVFGGNANDKTPAVENDIRSAADAAIGVADKISGGDLINKDGTLNVGGMIGTVAQLGALAAMTGIAPGFSNMGMLALGGASNMANAIASWGGGHSGQVGPGRGGESNLRNMGLHPDQPRNVKPKPRPGVAGVSDAPIKRPPGQAIQDGRNAIRPYLVNV